MSSKLLDFVRPGRKSRAILEAEGLTEVAAQVPLPEEAAPQAVPAARYRGVSGARTTIRQSVTGWIAAQGTWSAAVTDTTTHLWPWCSP